MCSIVLLMSLLAEFTQLYVTALCFSIVKTFAWVDVRIEVKLAQNGAH